MKKIYLLLVLYLSSISLLAQNSSLDTLSNQEISIRYKAFTQTNQQNLFKYDKDSLSYSGQSLLAAIEQKLSLLENLGLENEKAYRRLKIQQYGTIYYLVYNIHGPWKQMDSVLYYESLVKKIFSDDVVKKANMVKQVGLFKLRSGDVAGAINSLNEAIEGLRETNQTYLTLQTLNILLDLYFDYDLQAYMPYVYESAENDLKNDSLKTKDDRTRLSKEQYNLWFTIFRLRKANFLASSNGECEKAYGLLNSISLNNIEDDYVLNQFYIQSYYVAFACGNYVEAKQILDDYFFADDFKEFTNWQNFKTFLYARTYTRLNQLDKAKNLINIIEEDTNFSLHDKRVYEILAEYYKKVEDYQRGLFYLEKTLTILDSLNSNTIKISNELTAYNVKKDSEIAILEAEQTVNELRLKKERQGIIIASIGLVFFLIVIALIEIYRRKKKNLVLAIQLKESNKLNKNKNQFLENISHEMRTPLTVIRGYLSLIVENTVRPELISKYSEKAILSTQKLVTSLNDYLSLVSFEKGSELPFVESEGNLKTFLFETASSLSIQAAAKDCRLYYRSNILSNLEIKYNFQFLEKIITNLLVNSVKYSNSHTSIELTAYLNEDSLQLTVKDQGFGMSQEELTKIFDRFYQTQDNVSSGGFGIGLSLVKTLLDKLNGKLEVESDIGVGSRFQITLPLKTDHLGLHITEALSDFEQINDDIISYKPIDNLPKALLVDDDVSMVELLEELLQDTLNCSLAYNGEEALNLAKKESFDIIISDMKMPTLDGEGFKKELNKLEAYNEVPFIIISSENYSKKNQLKLELGFDDYIAKPFEKNEILTRVKILLEKNIHAKMVLSSEGDSVKYDSTHSELMNNIHKTISENITNKDFTTQVLARECGYSAKQLNLVTKSKLGLSPIQIILEVKLLKAYQSIINNQFETLSEVMYASGFNSRPYFYKKFYERFGVKTSDLKSKHSGIE